MTMETPPPSWLKEHLPHIAGIGSGVSGSATMFFFIFRDGINKWLEDWRDDRRARRAERTAIAGRADPLKDVVQALRDELKAQREMLAADIAAQRANEKETIALMGQVATAIERGVDVQRMTSNQMSDVDKRLLRIEGAMNGGRFQQ